MEADAEGKDVYYLANKLYRLTDSGAVKINILDENAFKCFYPVSKSNFWLSPVLPNYGSVLYHYVGGLLFHIPNPFSNTINLIHSYGSDKFIMSALLETAVYEKGRFYPLMPAPSRNSFAKFFLTDTSVIWLIDHYHKLFQYRHGRYHEYLPDKTITDFSFHNINSGIILAKDELYSMTGQGVKLLYKNSLLNDVQKILWLPDKRLIMVGKDGFILLFANNKLVQIQNDYKENLNHIVFTPPDNIWIGGEKGIILYSGSKKYKSDPKIRTSFTATNLVSYAVPLNNEYGVALADFNGDGKTDIYAVRIYEQNRLFINYFQNKAAPEQSFNDEVTKRNATGATSSSEKTAKELKLGVAVADIDNDNDQDIYLCYLVATNRLLINKGNGFFRNVSEKKKRACMDMNRSNAAVFADVDNDGDLDLFVTSEEGSNRLFLNDGTGHFADITQTSGLASTGGGMCASFADVNNDGLPDLAVSFWHPQNKLYINESKNGKVRFRDITSETDIAKASPAKSNAVTFADVNNDGFIDLFIANRKSPNRLYINNGKGIFIDKTDTYFKPEDYLTNGAVFADFNLDGYLDLYLTNVGENVLYKNINGQYFEDVTAAYGAELSGYGTGSAVADIDNDGDPDIYTATYVNGDSKLLINDTEKNSFIKLKLKGVISNKDAIGAKVWLYKKQTNGMPPVLAGYREMTCGNSYSSSSAKEIIFGCAEQADYYALIKFPTTKDTIKTEILHAGETLVVKEMEGPKAFFINTGTGILLFFKNRENHPEFIKLIFLAVMLFLYNYFNRRTVLNIARIQWFVMGMIFLLFVILNGLYLFEWPSFDYFMPFLISMVLLIIFHLVITRYISQKQATLEKQEIRNKISRDLHDDLASTLGSISIYSNTLEFTNNAQDINLPKKIAGLSQMALQSISDIIWMTAPRNDTLQSLISKLNSMLYELFEDNKIQFASAIQIPDKEIVVEEKLRNNVFLILKEAAHNILKHAQAKRVVFEVKFLNDFCFISLNDNGKGIDDTANISSGNGLINMRARALESDIDLTINTHEQKGTTIGLRFKI